MTRRPMQVVEVPMSAWTLLPARAGTCPQCATKHGPELPHNFHSVFWAVKFKLETGRDPTRADAFAHCSDDVKARWAEAERTAMEAQP